MSEETGDRSSRSGKPGEVDAIQLVRDALARIRFGAIQLTVHEGKLVQLEVTEKRRFT